MVRDHDALIRKMAAEGRGRLEIAEAIGAWGTALGVYCKREGIALVQQKRGPTGPRTGIRKTEFSHASKNARCMKNFGHDLATHQAIKNLSHRYDPITTFGAQRRGAKRRGITWQFSFAQWWNLWQARDRKSVV